jgi:hypothetical protein
VAPDRVISTVDDAMRHGRKTTSVKRDGYKAHVLTTNGASDEPHLVTAVVVTPANVADGDVTARLTGTPGIDRTGAGASDGRHRRER